MEIGEWVNCFILLIDGIIHIMHTPCFVLDMLAIDYFFEFVPSQYHFASKRLSSLEITIAHSLLLR